MCESSREMEKLGCNENIEKKKRGNKGELMGLKRIEKVETNNTNKKRNRAEMKRVKKKRNFFHSNSMPCVSRLFHFPFSD